MMKGVAKKSNQLGMQYCTAQNILKKEIFFRLVQEVRQDTCCHCQTQITKSSELSIEHKEYWQDKTNAKELFWDLNNIAFSHLKCNIKAKRPRSNNLKQIHPSLWSYKKGCKCEGCKKLKSLDNSKRKR